MSEMSFNEIAKKLNLNYKTVKNTYEKAMKKIAVYLVKGEVNKDRYVKYFKGLNANYSKYDFYTDGEFIYRLSDDKLVDTLIH